MARILYFILLLQVFSFNTVFGQTKVITTHNLTIVNNPKTGLANYSSWATFPSKKEKVRRIMMYVTLASPDSLKTARWDYCDHINILRVGGKNGEIKNYELGRLITPYGNKFSKDWNFTWKADVTDFSELLRDSVEIEFQHSGYEDTSFGWNLSINFQITYGEPHVEQFGVEKVWSGNFKYGNPEIPFEEQVKPYGFEMPRKAKMARLRIQHTGHGMDKPNNCSEFCSRWRKISIDNKEVQTKNLWKNCGDNPIYPQGGTWPYDRALWCPGELQEADIINVHLPKGEHTLNLEMEPYTSEKVAQPKENINVMLFYLGLPKNKHDVLLEEVIKPNNDFLYNRLNPAIKNPTIKIRNLGSEPLQYLQIKYYTLIDGEKYSEQAYTWTGYLTYNETTIIELPGTVYASRTEKNSFVVSCSLPNEQKDAWEGDNTMTVDFDAPQEMPREFIIRYKTNSSSSENKVEVRDINGTLICSRNSENTQANTMYTDTVRMPRGIESGTVSLVDMAGNGLEYWAVPEQGYGTLMLLDMEGHLIHEFEKDCGDGEELNFIISDSLKMDTHEAQHRFFIYPKAVDKEFTVAVHTDTPQARMDVLFIQKDQIRKKITAQKIDRHEYKFDTSKLLDEIFYLYIYIDGKEAFRAGVRRE